MKINTNKFLSTLIAIFAAISLVSCWGEKKSHEDKIVDHLQGIKNETWEAMLEGGDTVGDKKDEAVRKMKAGLNNKVVQPFNKAMKAAKGKAADAQEKTTSALKNLQTEIEGYKKQAEQAEQRTRKNAIGELVKQLETMQAELKKSEEELKKQK